MIEGQRGGTPGEGRGPRPSRVPSTSQTLVKHSSFTMSVCGFDVFEYKYELHNTRMRMGGTPGEGRDPRPSRVPSAIDVALRCCSMVSMYLNMKMNCTMAE